MKILITTSGTGSRLGELTKKRNKSLLKVGDKAVISHIIDSYGEKNNEFVITLGYLGQQVRDYLSLAHPDLNVTYVEVDKWEGPESSLLYSMWLARKYLQQPFVFNCCDNFSKKKLDFKNRDNTNKLVVGKFSLKENKYSTVSYRANEWVTNIKIYNKEEVPKCDVFSKLFSYFGIAIVVDYNKFWELAEEILKTHKNPNDISVFKEMLKNGLNFDLINTEVMDTGNLKDLNQVKKKNIPTLTSFKKDNEEIYKVGSRIIKWNESEEKISQLVARQPFVMNSPKIQSKGQFLSYNFIRGTPMSECLDLELFSKLLEEVKKNQNKSIILINTNAQEFYFKKTNERLELFYQQFPEYKNVKKFTLNGRTGGRIYNSFADCVNPSLKSHWHGDLVLDNIIVTPEREFVFIDWRTDYCGEIEFGDPLYDFAKLNHSLYLSNKQLLESQFKLKVEILETNAEVELDFQDSLIRRSCRKIIKNYFSSNICSATAIIWLNMAGLHAKDMPEMSKFLFWMAQAKLAGFLND